MSQYEICSSHDIEMHYIYGDLLTSLRASVYLSNFRADIHLKHAELQRMLCSYSIPLYMYIVFNLLRYKDEYSKTEVFI